MQPQFNFGRNAEREVDQHQILTLLRIKHTFGQKKSYWDFMIPGKTLYIMVLLLESPLSGLSKERI